MTSKTVKKETVVQLQDGWSLRSGVVHSGAGTAGDYVQLCDPSGTEYLYWDAAEWRDDPGLVMGALMNAAAGGRFVDQPDGTKERLPVYAEAGETVVRLADGSSIRCGVYDQNAEGARESGEYVRVCDPDGSEAECAYWDHQEWSDDPVEVMGAIINTAAGLRIVAHSQNTAPRDS